MADGDGDGDGDARDSRYSLPQADPSYTCLVMAEDYPDNEDIDELIERQLLGLDLQVIPDLVPSSPSGSQYCY